MSSILKKFGQTLKDENDRQKAEKKAAKEVRQAKGPFKVRLASALKVWGLRLFHLMFMSMIVYFTILLFTIMTPVVMGYVLGTLKYTLESAAELLLALFAGLFFTAWAVIGSYKLLGFVGKIFIKNWKKAADFGTKPSDEK